MNDKFKFKLRKILLLALKIGIGASVAYYIAELLGLQYASSAGIIALLTLQTTKWETLKLSLRRVVTYFMTYGLCAVLCSLLDTTWINYGIYLFLFVAICEFLGWRSVLSVNAVISAHFIVGRDFSVAFLMNELQLVLIGITLAIILNLFHINSEHEIGMIRAMRHIEHQMKLILQEVAGYLRHQKMGDHVWIDLTKLEEELDECLELAHEFQGNTFVSHPEYYINYFEMRKQQCGVIHNLHAEMQRIRNLPKDANLVAEYIENMSEHVVEMNIPDKQMAELEEIIHHVCEGELPTTREEFENQALLYHTLMDLEEFLMFKKRFVESIDEEQFRVYWKQEIQD